MIVLVNSRYYLYEIDRAQDFDFDCLDYYARDDMDDISRMQPFPQDHQIIPFCRRDNMNDDLLPSTDVVQSVNFDQLRESNVSATQMLQFSIPVDLVERYQAYVENTDQLLADASVQVNFCRTPDRFGSMCQYRFDIEVEKISRIDLCFISILLCLGGVKSESLQRDRDKTVGASLGCTVEFQLLRSSKLSTRFSLMVS